MKEKINNIIYEVKNKYDKTPMKGKYNIIYLCPESMDDGSFNLSKMENCDYNFVILNEQDIETFVIFSKIVKNTVFMLYLINQNM